MEVLYVFGFHFLLTISLFSCTQNHGSTRDSGEALVCENVDIETCETEDLCNTIEDVQGNFDAVNDCYTFFPGDIEGFGCTSNGGFTSKVIIAAPDDQQNRIQFINGIIPDGWTNCDVEECVQ